ncbi:MAG TPA: hypothetical protein PLV92_20230, partial [Pirellulaceae bacterium]|nr:hypothetical protein [Pirellulaceae bacterium]
ATGAGEDVTVYEADNLNVASTTLNGGDLLIRAGGPLGVSGSIAGASDVRLNSTGAGVAIGGGVTATGIVDVTAGGPGADLALTGSINAGASPVTLTAQRDVLLGSASHITTQGGNVTILADAQSPNGSGAIRMSDGATIDAGVGEILLVAEGDIYLTGLRTANAGANAVVVQSNSGAIYDAGNSAGVDIRATASTAYVTLQAARGIGAGASAIDTDIANLKATNRLSGAIGVNELNALNIDRVRQDGETGAINVEAQGDITLLDGRFGIATNATDAGDSTVTLISHHDIVANAPIVGSGGSIALYADRQVTFSAAGDMPSNGGDILVVADQDATGGAGGGAIMMADGAVIDGGRERNGGLVTLRASGDVTLGGVFTSGEADIVSNYGSITDGGDTDSNLWVGFASLQALSGIGDDSTSRGALESRTLGDEARFAATTSGGDIRIDNTGALTLGNVGGVNGVTITNPALGDSSDQIVITTASPLTVATIVSNSVGGDVLLAAQGSAETDDLTVDGVISTSGGNGRISLLAGDDIVFAATGRVAAANAGDVLISAGEDYHGGSSINGADDGDVFMTSGSSVRTD